MHAHRIDTFDYVKGIGIILVVYGHVARGVYNAGLPIDQGFYILLDSILYSFHMPLFFFVSGYFFPRSQEKRGAVELVRSKANTILYAYVVWSLIQGLIEFVLAPYTNGDVTLGQVFSLLWQPRAHFWFLYALFGIFLFSAVLYRKFTPAWTSLVLGLAVVLYLTGYSFVDIYLFNAFSQWFVYFALGASAACMLPRIDLRHPGWLALITMLFLMTQWGGVNGAVILGHAPVVRLALAIIGIGFVLLWGRQLAIWGWSWLAYLGRHSLEIYLIHILAGSGLRIVLQKMLDISDPAVHLVLGTLAGIVVPLLVAVSARNWRMGWLFLPPQRLRNA